MANVRYTGGRAATLGTKTIDENGVYNASSDDLDGYSSVNVEVPQPEGNIDIDITENGETVEDIADYETATINVNVPVPVVETQEKTIRATTSQQIVRPDTGKYLSKVTVDPQIHSNSYTPTQNTTNDMGAQNNYRYVDTRGLYKTQGAKTLEYTANGVYNNVDVNAFQTADITVDVPVSGTVGPKTITVNGVYEAIDDNLDGYDEVTVNVPQNATLGVKNITANGDYYASTDNLDGFSRVSVAVPGGGSTLQDNKTVTATTSQQIVQPDPGYDGLEQVTVNPQTHSAVYTPQPDTLTNDMGEHNNYRYVNTSGMEVAVSITPSNSDPVSLISGIPVKPTRSGYAIQSISAATPSDVAPEQLYEGSIYYIDDTDGYLIESLSSTTPSDSNPPQLLQNNIYKPTASGYLYETQQSGAQVATGTFTLSANSDNKITTGFEPKYLAYSVGTSGNVSVYNKDISTTQYKKCTSGGISNRNIGNTTTYDLVSLSNDGFTVRGASSAIPMYYFAIG